MDLQYIKYYKSSREGFKYTGHIQILHCFIEGILASMGGLEGMF
jgi:hypothetical protein